MRGIQLAMGVVALMMAGCGKVAHQPDLPPPSVQVRAVALEQVRPSAEFVGRTQAFEDVHIQAQVSGQLVQRHFTEGDKVSQGDLLFSLDPESFQAQVNQANAVLAQAEAARDVAVINWERGRRLHPDGVISDTDMDELTSRKLQAEAQVVQAKAGLDAAALQLEYAQVRAPITGRISNAFVSTGDLITPQTQLATLVQSDPFWVTFQASERQMAAARTFTQQNPDQAVRLSDLDVEMRMPDGEMYDQIGFIDFVDNRVDAATGTVNLRAKFTNPDGWVLPGTYVTLVIRPQETEARLLVPQASVQEDQQGRYVMVLGEGNQVNKRMVTLGQRYGVQWAVLEGLKEGETIVVEGLQKIRPGAVVNPVVQEIQPFKQDAQG
ncbi:efflux RND transporter periplasmic adaptor subunit [Ferrimonas balearica]|uniref:efflux RND transporter periplasmic adaptor subunit n=1 Tax=Ferrimonas balearica TaxID=44012 RepID=UPI001C994A75|nr:efflux RND transporter periplasmic adaptor subunit [Ferrimonas balearica]MBY5921957.1 efflux RND transporter periplasmic adaptor subunit [Ferrimonas balearica]MBY5994703.1 efflux RND transporter periplasmic adaptor subunit [Ferrimonas balearica]